MIKKLSEITGDQIILIPEEFKIPTKKVLLTFDTQKQILSITPIYRKSPLTILRKSNVVPNRWENSIFPLTNKERREIKKYKRKTGYKTKISFTSMFRCFA